ncbi:Hypothetical predicted protein [Mytilus galloprovincialis]|uniref:Uncharacterized protein n=1 Tax=Mytilus galloprovincialis TaxID=29158 RepID=A0A8B6DDJ8_MYTGA|nr:Hypothetical predicted protein [Mytilus galloprovincialis]
MQSDGIPIEYRVNTRIMSSVQSISQSPQESGDKDTLKGRMSQVEINKRMESNSDNMDHYQDFFLENEEDLEESTPAPTPQKQQQCCDAPNLTQMDEHTQMCQNCGAQFTKPRFEHQPDGEQKTTCGYPLKRKKGQLCKSKPGKDGLCWRHSKTPRQQEEERSSQSREVLSKKQLKALAKNRGLTKYSQLKRDDLNHLVEEDIKNAPVEDEINVTDRRQALNGVFGTVVIEPAKQHDVATFLKVSRSTVTTTISDALAQKKGLKVNLVLLAELVKTDPATGENKYVTPYFRSAQAILTQSSDLELEIDFMMGKVKENMAKYMREGSGWTLGHVENLEIHLNQFNPLKGASFIPTPSALAKKKAIINVQNKDQECFKWAILSALHHEEVDQKNTNRPSQYVKWEDDLKFEGIDFPVSLRAIDKFERCNVDLNINVYGYDGLKKGEDGEEDLQVYIPSEYPKIRACGT